MHINLNALSPRRWWQHYNSVGTAKLVSGDEKMDAAYNKVNGVRYNRSLLALPLLLC